MCLDQNNVQQALTCYEKGQILVEIYKLIFLAILYQLTMCPLCGVLTSPQFPVVAFETEKAGILLCTINVFFVSGEKTKVHQMKAPNVISWIYAYVTIKVASLFHAKTIPELWTLQPNARPVTEPILASTTSDTQIRNRGIRQTRNSTVTGLLGSGWQNGGTQNMNKSNQDKNTQLSSAEWCQKKYLAELTTRRRIHWHNSKRRSKRRKN